MREKQTATGKGASKNTQSGQSGSGSKRTGNSKSTQKTNQNQTQSKSKKASSSRSQSSQKKTTEKKGKTYSMSGELEVATSEAPKMMGTEEGHQTPTMVVDSNGNVFTPTSLTVIMDGEQMLLQLDAIDTELVMKALKVVPYAD